MGCCAFGTCPNSLANGGKGCYLCDVVAKLPQQSYRKDASRKDEHVDGSIALTTTDTRRRAAPKNHAASTPSPARRKTR